MIKYSYILISFYLLLQSCNSPLDIDATRIKDTIYDPNNLPAVIEINPMIIDLNYSYIGDDIGNEIKIKNISEKNITIDNISFGDNQLSLLPIFQKFELNSKNQANSEKLITLQFKPSKLGKYLDTIRFNDYKKPYLIIKSIVPTVYGRDVSFKNTPVNGLDGEELKLYNDGDEKVMITELTILDELGVFFNQPKISVPFEISPHSYQSIILNFNPKKASDYSGQITFKCNSSGFIDDTIKLIGKGF